MNLSKKFKDVFVDENDVIFVGQKIRKSKLYEKKMLHSVVLPKRHEVTTLIV